MLTKMLPDKIKQRFLSPTKKVGTKQIGSVLIKPVVNGYKLEWASNGEAIPGTYPNYALAVHWAKEYSQGLQLTRAVRMVDEVRRTNEHLSDTPMMEPKVSLAYSPFNAPMSPKRKVLQNA